MQITQEYDIFGLGFDRLLNRELAPLNLMPDLGLPSFMQSGFYETNPSVIGSGELRENISLVEGYLQSSNFVTGVTGWRIDADGNLEANSGTFRGTITASALDIPDTTTANSFHVETDGDTFWGCNVADFVSDPNNAIAYVLKTGAAKFSNVILTGLQAGSAVDAAYLSGLVLQGNLNVANRGWTQTCVFSITDADTVAWGTGTFTASDGTAYSIAVGNTGNMSAKTYIYLDTAISTTAYQVTTTSTTAVGAGKVLIAIAQNGTGEATYQVLQGQGGQNIDASSIVAGSVTANELSSSITYTGSLIISAGGHIRGNQTDYATGTGFFLGYSGGAYKFSIGNGSDPNNLLTWDGVNLTVNNSTLSSQDIYGDGTDGDVDINSGTFSSGPITNNVLTRDAFLNNLTLSGGDLNCGGYRLIVKGILTINSGYKIHRNGNNGSNGGNATGYINGCAGNKAEGLASGSMYGSPAGQHGAVGGRGLNSSLALLCLNGGNGTTGTGTAKNIVGAGKAGGNGGFGGGGFGACSAGTGAGAGAATGTVFNYPHNIISAYFLYDTLPSPDILRTSSGSGSAGGGGGGGYNKTGDTNIVAGGGGGGAGSASSGGILFIAAKKIVNNGSIQVNGGKGGDGGNGADATSSTLNSACGGGGGGGGGAGNGGLMILIYSTLSGSGTITATAGVKGNKGIGGNGLAPYGVKGYDGQDGTVGSDGIIIQLQR